MGFKTNVKREELRYGSILLTMDADEDGSHIKGLFINFLDYFYPHLMSEKGFLKILVTPVVKATLNDKIFSFANLRAYNTWYNSEKNVSKWTIKYYKGLGTSTSKEAQEYFINLEKNTIDILNNDNNDDILLAFSKDKVNQRKEWLINYDPDNILQLEPPTTITLKQFVNQELIHFSNYDNIRSIPLIIDGFKPSQRKVIFACLKKNLTYEMKISQLAGAVAEITDYHHGEQSLVSTIINLTQNFIGSNNVNLLEPIGQLGTRLLGGKDHASARYVFTKISLITEKLIKKEDNDILEYDEGQPKFFLPILPICLLNGAEGIGTGFSTSIPNFNLDEIKEWYVNRLSNKKNNDLFPFYNNFTGKIFKFDDSTFISQGIAIIEDNKVIISELPIKLWTSDYKDFLEILMEDSVFKSYQNLSSDTQIMFVLKINDIEKVKSMLNTLDDNSMNDLYKYLKLYKTLKISNLTLYDIKFKLNNYKSIEEILEEFYMFRLDYYDKRKINLLSKLNNNKEYLLNQIKFIELVIENRKIFAMNNDKLDDFLKSHKIKKYDDSYDYILNLSFKQMSENNLDKLNNKVKDIKKEISEITSKNNKDLWLNDLLNL